MAAGRLEQLVLLLERVQRGGARQRRDFHARLGLGFEPIDLLVHLVHRREGLGVVGRRQCVGDGLLRFGPFLSSDEQGTLTAGFVDLLVDRTERFFEGGDRFLLLDELGPELSRDHLVFLLAGERLNGEVVAVAAHEGHRLLLPVFRRGLVALEIFGQSFLVGDRHGDAALRLHQLLAHVGDRLIQHLLRVFGPVDEVVQV